MDCEELLVRDRICFRTYSARHVYRCRRRPSSFCPHVITDRGVVHSQPLSRLRIPDRRPDTLNIHSFGYRPQDEWPQDDFVARGIRWVQVAVRYVTGEEVACLQLHPFAKTVDIKEELMTAGLPEKWFDAYHIAIEDDVLCLSRYYFLFNPWAPHRPISRILKRQLEQERWQSLELEALAVRTPTPLLRDCQDCGNLWPEDRWIWAKCWRELPGMDEGDWLRFQPITSHTYCEPSCSQTMSCPDTNEIACYLVERFHDIDVINGQLAKIYKEASDFGNDNGYRIVDDTAWRAIAFTIGSHSNPDASWKDAAAYLGSCDRWSAAHAHSGDADMASLWNCRHCDPHWLGWVCRAEHGCQRTIPPWRWTPSDHFGTCSDLVTWKVRPGQLCACCRAIFNLPTPCDQCTDFRSLRCTCRSIWRWVVMKRR